MPQYHHTVEYTLGGVPGTFKLGFTRPRRLTTRGIARLVAKSHGAFYVYTPRLSETVVSILFVRCSILAPKD